MELFRKAILFVAFLSVCLIFFPYLVSPVLAEATRFVRVYGRVIDATTSLPLPNANIVFWNDHRLFITETDPSGFYTVNTTERESYQVFAYHNDSTVLGFGFIPAHEEVYVHGGICNLSFVLSQGASINVKGGLRFFKTLQPPTTIDFTIVYKSGLHTNATSYGEDSVMGNLLNIRGWLLFVPCDVPIKVEVDIHYSGEADYHLLIDHEGDFLILNRGGRLNVNLERQVLSNEINSCYGYTASTEDLVDQAERMGFYVLHERNELLGARELLEASKAALARDACDAAYANLREAYFTIRRIAEYLPSLWENAAVSTLFITPFLCFTSIAVAALVSEKKSRRLIISLLLYVLLFVLLNSFYSGYITLGLSRALTFACIVFLPVYCVVHGLPYILKERTSGEDLSIVSAIIMAFSLSVKNLRRRKLRTFLTVSLLFISVFAFIALTSFSLENGFAVQYLGNLSSMGVIEGLFIQKPSTNEMLGFDPIQPEIFEWINELPEVTLAAPKIENIPQESHLGLLIAPFSQSTFGVFGIVAVMPSLETRITEIDKLILQGRFLEDADLDGILISEIAADLLGVGINDTLQLFNQNLTLIGIFDSRSLNELVDFDGATPFAPYILSGAEEIELDSCPGYETVILHQKVAQGFPGMVLSRIVVQIRDAKEIMPLARQAVLKWEGIEVLSFLKGEVYRLFIGSFYLASGFIPAIVPLALAALNIGVSIRNMVYERKRELTVMSTLGLNPFHITALFLAEALTIGIVAGSLGYLLGITSYRFMTFLPFAPQVKQKVETVWGILALLSAITASALGSALPALRSSGTITPSLVRKWKIERKPRGLKEPWVLSMPIRLKRDRLNDFYTFMRDHLRGHRFGVIEAIETVGVVREGKFDPVAKKLFFNYVHLERGVNTENSLVSTESLVPDWYMIKLATVARRTPQSELSVRITASLVRRLILLYATKRQV